MNAPLSHFTPADPAAVLQARAAALAARAVAADTGATLEVVEFLLGGERYGIESRCVREVCPVREITPLPGTPEFVLGIVNVRGQVLTVIDLRRVLQLGARGLSDLNQVVIVRVDGREVGILADAIAGVRRLRETELQPAGAALAGGAVGRVRGLGPERLVVLDAAAVLNDAGLVVNEAAAG